MDAITTKSRSEVRRSLFLLAFVVTALFASWKAGNLVTSALERSIKDDVDGTALSVFHKQRPFTFSDETVLLQFGFEDSQKPNAMKERGISLTHDGLSAAAPWNSYAYPWHISGGRFAALRLAFPPNSVGQLGLFLADGDGEWRIARIRTESHDLIADRLYQGRWLHLTLSEKEKSSGRVTIHIESLMGPGVAVSALALD